MPANITFLALDTLPDNSLIRPLITDIFGEITLISRTTNTKKMKYRSHDLSVEIVLNVWKSHKWNMRICMMNSAKLSSTITTFEPERLFAECIRDLELQYRIYYSLGTKLITRNRLNPIYQLIENWSINRTKEYTKWKGFSIFQSGITTYLSYNGCNVWRHNGLDAELMLAEIDNGTAPDEVYNYAPILRTKSARNS